MRVREASPDAQLAVRNVLDGAMLAVENVSERIEAGDVLVAVEESRVLGAVVLDPRESATHVVAVAVRPGRRGRGIGSALVTTAADRRGRLTAAFDERVRPFYEALDFDIEERDGRLWGRYEPEP